MKTVLLSEGKNDLLFYTKLCKTKCNYTGQNDIISFRQPEYLRKGELENEESHLIDSCTREIAEHKIWIKSENGKPNLFIVFREFCFKLKDYKNNVKTIVCFDTETGDFGTCVKNEICNVMKSQRPSLNIAHTIKIAKKSIKVAEVTVTDRENDVPWIFFVAALDPSLEILAGIDDNDDNSVKERKIATLLEKRQDIVESLRTLLV